VFIGGNLLMSLCIKV